MRRFINYIRSICCKHEWELIKEISTYEDSISVLPAGLQLPVKTRRVYRCIKCGCIQRITL